MPSPPEAEFRPRPFEPEDAAWVHRLNTAHEIELSPLTEAALASLVLGTTYAAVVEPRAGFLLAFDQACDYDSPNFLWFGERLPNFIYVDRIAVDPDFRGRGIARRLYDELFDFARTHNHERVVCEVNTMPPNPGSDAFHAALGFTEMGRAELAERGKAVRYLCKTLQAG